MSVTAYRLSYWAFVLLSTAIVLQIPVLFRVLDTLRTE